MAANIQNVQIKKPYAKPEVRQIKRVVACGGHKV